MIDFHVHLDLYPHPEKVVLGIIERKMQALSVTTTPSAWRGTYALSKNYPLIKTALGLHPQIVHHRLSELELFDTYIAETDYVGEVGLDGSKNLLPHINEQKTALNHILLSCKHDGGKVISLHSRNAASELLELLMNHPNAGTPVLHWFSGTNAELKLAIQMGCRFSIGPAMFNSKKGRSIISKIPINRVVTETDGPFASNKGKFLYPWDIDQAITGLSSIWGTNIKETNEILSDNHRDIISTTIPKKPLI